MELHRVVIHRDGTRLVLVVLDYNNNNIVFCMLKGIYSVNFSFVC